MAGYKNSKAYESDSSGGTIDVPGSLRFADAITRDDYFTTNPSKLKKDVYVTVAGQLQRYNGDTFEDTSVVIKGDSGEDAEPMLLQYSATGFDGWSNTLNSSIHKYWRWSTDGGITWSPDGVRYSATSSDTGIPDPYSYQVGTNGKLQMFKDGLMISEQDEEGTWIANSIATGTGSLHIGEIHNNGSGGEQVVWVNEDSKIAYYPSWGGVSLDGTQRLPTAARTHGGLQSVTPNGTIHGAGVMDYNYQFTCPEDSVFFGLDIVPAETFQGRLRWKVLKNTGKEVAAFYFEANFTQGVVAKIPFKYPLWATTGQVFQLTLAKDDGTLLQVFQGDDNTLPWRKNYFSTFTDNEMYHEGNVTALSQDLSNLTGSERIAASAIRDFPAASGTEYGMVKIGHTMSIDGNGKLDANVAAAEKKAVSDETAMLALPQISNLYIVTRTDVDKLFYLNANEDPAEITNWEEGASVGDTVSTFNGRSGAVLPATGDYTQKQIKTIHDNNNTEGWFGIDDTGIYYDDGV